MGEQVLGEGDAAARASTSSAQVREMAPDNPEVIGGLARALIAAGEPDEARALLDGLPDELAKQAGDRPRPGRAGGRFDAPAVDIAAARSAARGQPRRP